ncbi:MAG: transcription termination factor Rho [Alloprevotella sp.]|nr:MAG: transcription termination factor Rho [Alloprevotella sp.]
MPKYTKEQLLAMPIEELQSMAVTMKTPNCTSSIREQLVYDIIDAQADEVSNGVEAAPRRRRITTYGQDHVYSATQTGNSERFDSARDERAAKKMVAEKARETEAEAVKALLDAGQVEEPPKRRRGRPTKAEVEQRRAYEEMMFRQKKMMHQAQLSSNALISEANDVETEAEDALPPFMRQPIEHPHVMESYVPGVGAEKENASATEGASIETENAAHTAQSTVSGTAANDADNEDLPDFILAQIRQQANAPAVATTAEQEETSDEKLPNLHNPLETLTQRFQTQSHARFSNLPALEKAPEGEFVIVEDVPIIDNTNFNFIPEAEEPSFYGVPEVTQAPRFRKFKDDALVNPQLLNRTEGGAVVQTPVVQEVIIEGGGVLELTPQGAGFLRSSDYNYMPSPDDIFVNQNQVRNYALKMGDVIEGKVKVPREGEKYFALTSIERINGLPPHQVRDRIAFEHLTPLFPDEQFKLSTQPNAPLACRTVDLFSPIGKGQRALIVAQPKTGKTILMKQIANAIAANYPDTYLMMLLIDERPEEVTDMARTVNAEVIASTFDEPATHHVRIAQMVLEKAKRMVECGHDVVIFLDSITRLARAFNTVAPTSGKILTGGVDANALQKPKRFFGAARNIENGGSLTIIATALTDTGSKMDEVIFEEFKGTGNMELQLDRTLANKRIFPAVNLIQSSTRRDDLLLDEGTLNRMYIIRKFIGDMSSVEAMDFVKKRLEDSRSNEEFLMKMNK